MKLKVIDSLFEYFKWHRWISNGEIINLHNDYESFSFRVIQCSKCKIKTLQGSYPKRIVVNHKITDQLVGSCEIDS